MLLHNPTVGTWPYTSSSLCQFLYRLVGFSWEILKFCELRSCNLITWVIFKFAWPFVGFSWKTLNFSEPDVHLVRHASPHCGDYTLHIIKPMPICPPARWLSWRDFELLWTEGSCNLITWVSCKFACPLVGFRWEALNLSELQVHSTWLLGLVQNNLPIKFNICILEFFQATHKSATYQIVSFLLNKMNVLFYILM